MSTTDDVIPALWPDAELGGWQFGRGGRSQERSVVRNGLGDVRNVFPWRPSAIMAASRRTSDDRSKVDRWRDPAGVAALLTLAVVRRRWQLGCTGGGSLIARVAEELGHAGARGTVMCGPPRANRKPVVQLHDRLGRTIAFVKVAFNPLTHRLLEAERAALGHLAAQRGLGFSVPPILGSGAVSDARWLAIGPLTVERRLRHDLAATDALALAIQRSATSWHGPVSESTFAQRIVTQSAGLTNAGPIVAALSERDGGLELATAASHGDFVPWNTLSGTPEPAVWDWERYATDIPVGFDRLHHRIQVGTRRDVGSLRDVVLSLDAALPAVLPDVDAAARHAHLDWYLAQMLCRYESDVREVPNQRLDRLIGDISSVLKERLR